MVKGISATIRAAPIAWTLHLKNCLLGKMRLDWVLFRSNKSATQRRWLAEMGLKVEVIQRKVIALESSYRKAMDKSKTTGFGDVVDKNGTIPTQPKVCLYYFLYKIRYILINVNCKSKY